VPATDHSVSELRIGVMGAGSIGCYVGGWLLASGADVVLVGRPRLQAEIATHGLHVRGVEGAASVDGVRYETELSALADRDVVLVCVKSAQTEEVGAALAGVLSDALVVSLQNGVRNAPTLASSLERVAPAVVGFNVVSEGDGVFHSGLSGALIFEASQDGLHRRLMTTLRRTKIPVEVKQDLAPEQWTKLAVNLNNAISALSGAATRDLLLTPGYRRIIADVVQESLDVMKAASIRPAPLRGVPLGLMPKVLRMPTPIVRLVTGAQMKVDPHARSSMWEDLQRGRRTEVDFLNGEVVRLAESVGTTAPLNRRIVELVHEAEEGEPPSMSPAELRAALHG